MAGRGIVNKPLHRKPPWVRAWQQIAGRSQLWSKHGCSGFDAEIAYALSNREEMEQPLLVGRDRLFKTHIEINPIESA